MNKQWNDYHKKRWQMSNKEQTKGKLLNKQMNGQNMNEYANYWTMN